MKNNCNSFLLNFCLITNKNASIILQGGNLWLFLVMWSVCLMARLGELRSSVFKIVFLFFCNSNIILKKIFSFLVLESKHIILLAIFHIVFRIFTFMIWHYWIMIVFQNIVFNPSSAILFSLFHSFNWFFYFPPPQLWAFHELATIAPSWNATIAASPPWMTGISLRKKKFIKAKSL